MWKVQAGVIPGVPIKEHARRWFMTSEAWQIDVLNVEEIGDASGPMKSTFMDFGSQAHAYAASITDPRYLNWVTVTWMWM
jgi:hypothetical protein